MWNTGASRQKCVCQSERSEESLLGLPEIPRSARDESATWTRYTGRAFLALATLLTAVAPRAGAQTSTAATDYILSHTDREEMVRVPMRDGVRLSATILFPAGKPRQNLPTVLIFFPYLTEGVIRGGLFSPY